MGFNKRRSESTQAARISSSTWAMMKTLSARLVCTCVVGGRVRVCEAAARRRSKGRKGMMKSRVLLAGVRELSR